jgi:hypothetical protein
MVLPHAWALEKEFNERVVVLMASGCSQLEAGRLASDDASLDRFIALAPLCIYDELEPRLHLAAKTATRLGTFPVPESLSFGIPQACVDLRRILTTDVSLIDVEPMRLASLLHSLRRIPGSAGETLVVSRSFPLRRITANVGPTDHIDCPDLDGEEDAHRLYA